jgi:hypothetical protein
MIADASDGANASPVTTLIWKMKILQKKKIIRHDEVVRVRE